MEQAEKNNIETILDFDEWRNTDQATYFEFFQLNKLGDYLNKEQRQRILDVARVMFPNAEKGLYTEEITQRQKEEPWKRTGALRAKKQPYSRYAGGDAQACGTTAGHSAPAPGVNLDAGSVAGSRSAAKFPTPSLDVACHALAHQLHRERLFLMSCPARFHNGSK